jgi:hypothetical protein
MNITTDVNAPCPVTAFVMEVGKELLAEKRHDWMDLEALSDFCRSHEILLNGKKPATSELETTLREFFQPHGEFYAPGLNVDGYERPQGWERPFMIRAYPYHLVQPADIVVSTEPDLEQPTPIQCAEG